MVFYFCQWFCLLQISDVQPGKGQFLDYTKADLWAVGVLAFEIFGISDHFNWKTRQITHFPGEYLLILFVEKMF